MRVWVVSDVHSDYKQNLQWCHDLSTTEFQEDSLIVAGDVSDSLDVLKETLQCFVQRWQHVFFSPGNHDLWVRHAEIGQYDSIGKLDRINAVCALLGVHTEAKCVEGVWIVPLYSWYHASWDREADVPGAYPVEKMMVDFQCCKWPTSELNARDTSLADFFDAMNEPVMEQLVAALEVTNAAPRPPIISFSHFLPLQDLLPEKRVLFHPNLAKACGSDPLAARIARLQPLAHIFGHTHFAWDATIAGVRYLQWPLGYPRESNRSSHGQPLMLYDTEKGLAPKTHPYWSSMYEGQNRQPNHTVPAPWVNVSPRFM